MGTHISSAFDFHTEYIAAQRRLLARLDQAQGSDFQWPTAGEYRTILQLGRSASLELLKGLRDHKDLRCESRIARIQRLSAKERLWQPSPELWLRQQSTT